MTKTITLPLPSSKLSPNARLHWAVKSREVRKHRTLANATAWKELGVKSGLRFASYVLCFYWPDKRKRDADGAGSRCKAYLDGIADAIGQDDSEWQLTEFVLILTKQTHPKNAGSSQVVGS